MYFILAKVTNFFLAPLNWMFALLLWLFFTKSARAKKRLAIAMIAIQLLFGNEVIYTKIVYAWQPKQVQLSNNSYYDAGILLGGLSSFDKYGKGFLNSASDRLIETFMLYKEKKIKKILISGGSIYAKRPKEADFLFNELLLLGVRKEDLIVENRSRTTFENAVYSKRIIDTMRLQPPFVLVTSAIHMPRAQKVFNKAGLPVIAFPSDFQVFDKKFDFTDYFIPKFFVLNDWAGFLKEVVGIAAYKLFDRA